MRENGIEIDSRTKRPEFWTTWPDEQKRIWLRGRAQRAGVPVDELEEIIVDVIKSCGPELRQLRRDIPGEVAAAIRELKKTNSTRKTISGKSTCSGRCENCRPKCWET
jgi:hypothetical protein